MVLAVSLAGQGWTSGSWHRPFAVLGPDQGLPNGGILSIAQDADGFLWMGTESGLLRYEGGQITRWTRKQGFPSDFIDRLLAVPDGGLWVSTAQGLVWFAKGRVEPVRFEGLEAPPGIRAMALDGSGRLWVATSRGLFIQGQDLLLRRHPFTFPGRIFTVSSGRLGAMHIGTDRGLTTLHPNGSVVSWTPAQGLPKAGVNLVGEDGSGRLWVCSGRQLVMKEPGAGGFTERSSSLQAGVTPFGFFFRDQDGSLWLPTQKGALHLHDARTTLLDVAAGLPMHWVRNVFRDREGGFWIIGPTLARLQGNDRVWNHPLTEGPSGQVVWSILREPRGDLLVGTDDGVVRMTAAGAQRIPGTEGRRVKGMALDRSGRLWMVGTTGPTLWLPSGGHRAIVAPLGEQGQNLNSVMTDSVGRTWISHTRLGILRWDPARKSLVQEVGPEGIPSGALSAYRMREDATGRIWAATTLGLHLREPSGLWRLFTEKDGILPFGLNGLALLPDGSAWLHSREPQGLQRVRIEHGRVSVLEQRRAGQGIHSDVIYAVEVDPQGRTWATTDQGFDCLDTQVHVGRREGVISEDCDLLALLAERDRIWVGTSAGLVRYEPGDREAPASAPVPHILYVTKGEQRLDGPLDSLGPVGPRESSLAFRVAVPSYRHEGQLKIQTRMVGLEETWRDLDAPLTRYQALPGGTYRFEARAAQPDGAFGPVVGLSFDVQPRWWRTWWALTLWGIGTVGLILLIVRQRVASLAQSKVELEALVAKRTEELRNRNGELTEALGKVRQLSGLLPICASCKKIRDDKGYWNQLEQNFSAHTDVGFSHGICPDCAERLYPGYAARQVRRDPASK
jgi:ligand-binding sensor domain-containing protein